MPGAAEQVEPQSDARAPRLRLWSALLIAVTGGFVTALIMVTNSPGTYWPLYLVPIVIAALAYHVSGALIASAMVTALVVALTRETATTAASIPQFTLGMTVFLLSGVVIGLQAHRQEQHAEVLEQASIRDQLTGLYKCDYLHNRLNEEIRRCDRYSTPVGLIVLSVDDYQGFKERYGHYKADLMLSHVADLMRMSSRDTDIVARFSPTEFAVILPFASSERARLVAERVQNAVAVAEFEGDVIDPVTRVTVSTASAAYPADAADQDELIRLVTGQLRQHQPVADHSPSVTFDSLQVPS